MNYDSIILEHYRSVASAVGISQHCTMDDERIRELETDFIINSISSYIQLTNTEHKLKLIDVGCGNGYTLKTIGDKFKDIILNGVEFTPELLALARANESRQINFEPGDIRNLHLEDNCFDIIICQRVIINLLLRSDQELALIEIARILKPGGIVIMIEAFEEGLFNLNKARREFNLEDIPPAHHNLYLHMDIFSRMIGLAKLENIPIENTLSTHYYLSRVFHDVCLKMNDSGFIRNSLFLQFFDKALPLSIGEFSPLKFLTLVKS